MPVSNCFPTESYNSCNGAAFITCVTQLVVCLLLQGVIADVFPPEFRGTASGLFMIPLVRERQRKKKLYVEQPGKCAPAMAHSLMQWLTHWMGNQLSTSRCVGRNLQS